MDPGIHPTTARKATIQLDFGVADRRLERTPLDVLDPLLEAFLMMAAGKFPSSPFLCPHRRYICQHVEKLPEFGRQLAVRPECVR